MNKGKKKQQFSVCLRPQEGVVWGSERVAILWSIMFWKNKSIKQMTTWKGETQTGITTQGKYNKELTQINFQKVSKRFAKS